MALYGLIGKNIAYSFSKAYFESFFTKNQLPHSFTNFDLPRLEQFPKILEDHPQLQGLCVTIPYKIEVMRYLDSLDTEAMQIGAVNSIKITPAGQLIGYNTDAFGFQKSLQNHLQQPTKALVLGTGGASLAVTFVLRKLQIPYVSVSRNPTGDQICYEQITPALIEKHQLIVNCTPLGVGQWIDHFPKLPYEEITPAHWLFDLGYNPPETAFLRKGKQQGARLIHGKEMLIYQAQKSWELWNLK